MPNELLKPVEPKALLEPNALEPNALEPKAPEPDELEPKELGKASVMFVCA